MTVLEDLLAGVRAESAHADAGADDLPQEPHEVHAPRVLSIDDVDALLKSVPTGLTGTELSTWLTPILVALTGKNSVVQEVYLKQIKANSGIGLTTLRKQLGEVRREVAAKGDPIERTDHAGLAERMLADLRGKNDEALVYAEGQLYKYNGESHLWTVVDSDHQHRTVIGYSASHQIMIEAKDMSGVVKVAYRLAGCANFFAIAPKGISFSNGFLSWTDGAIAFKQLTAEHRARIALPFPYRPQAKAHRWHRFLRQCFKGDPAIGAKIRLLQEFIGACLFGEAAKFARILVLLGGGSNGKSVFLDVVSALLPAISRASIAPQKFDSDYHLAGLAGVRINIVAELPEGELLASEVFKAVVAGDEVTARAPYKEPFAFRPIAGHLFASNRLPATADMTHGFWRRILVVAWPRLFKEEEQDKHLAAKIAAAEMPAIAAWVVKGAERLLARGRYDIPKSVENSVDMWRQGADPVATFRSEETVPASSDSANEQFSKDVRVLRAWSKSKMLYDLYKVWAKDNGYKEMSHKTFGDRLTALEVPKEKRADATYYKLTPVDDAVCPQCRGFRRPGIEHACH